jgi:hypothetical protein
MIPTSPNELAELIIEAIIEAELTFPIHERADTKLISYVSSEVTEQAEIIWTEYLTGIRDTIEPSAEELTEIWNRAGERYTEEVFDRLVDIGMIEAGIDASGEILYKPTEEGIKAAGLSKPKRKRKNS